jgi:hypothetical protein
MSSQAVSQLTELQDILQNRLFDENLNDDWHYSWGTSTFHTKKAYMRILGSVEASPLFAWLWSSDNLGKHRFFF